MDIRAVGLGPPGSGPLVTGPEATKLLSIGDGVGGRPAVVGQDPLDPDPELGELGRGNLERVGPEAPDSSATGTTTTCRLASSMTTSSRAVA
jgi:hypothetical protein